MSYESPEDKARHDLINPALEKSGWKIQHFNPNSTGSLTGG